MWDLDVFNRLGDSLAHWQRLLTEIKRAHTTFNTTEMQKEFRVSVMDYEQMQARVNVKSTRGSATFCCDSPEARKHDDGNARVDPQGLKA